MSYGTPFNHIGPDDQHEAVATTLSAHGIDADQANDPRAMTRDVVNAVNLGLNLYTLRDANQARKTEPPAFKACADWTISDWYMAMSGESGELANLLKKVRRGDVQPGDQRIADEFADVLIYLDILAAEMGVDLAEAVTRKFNAKSQEIGSDVFLPPV